MHQDDYRKLRDLWYKKLKDDGFKDIETKDKADSNLIRWDSLHFQHAHTPTTFEAIQSYYYLATQFLNSRSFKDTTDGRIEKEIWHLHSIGHTLRHIATLIQSRFDVVLIKDRYNKDNVAAIIKRLQKCMYTCSYRERNE